MSYYSKLRLVDVERLPKAIERVNILHQWLNDNLPKIRQICEQATILKSGQLDHKSRVAMKGITDWDVAGPVRAHISVVSTSIYLSADITYPCGEYGCNYHKVDRHVGPDRIEDSDNFPIYTAEEVKSLMAERVAAIDAARAATEKAEEIDNQLRPFGWKM